MTRLLNSIKLFDQKLIDLKKKLSFKSEKAAKIFSIVLFLVGINILYSYVGIYKLIDQRPFSFHISAQTSRASIALNYYENNMNFFTPQYQRNIEGKGYTGLEFPVIYYVAAVFYKLFGFNEIYLRVISLVVFTLGLLVFYLFSLRYTKSNLISAALITAVICSPVLLFYSANFMPDAPSVGLVLAAWHFLFKYLDTEKKSHLNLFVILATLGVLLKVTAAICFVIVFILIAFDKFKFFRSQEKQFLFKEPKKIIFRMLGGLFIVAAWYKFSAWYPKAHGGETFLMSPNMYDNWTGLLEVLNNMYGMWLNHYYSYESYFLLACVGGVIVLGMKLVNRLLFTITILYIFGCLFYFIFFLNQFIHHDYYIITMFPAIFFLFLCFADIIRKVSDRYFFLTGSLLMVMLFFNVKESIVKCRNNFDYRSSRHIYYWTGDFRAYEDLEPKLRKLGIQRDERVISGFDNSDCASLYLMNQLGLTFGSGATKHLVDSFIQHKNAKYLVLTDSAKFQKEYSYDFSDKVIATHRGLIIYKLK